MEGPKAYDFEPTFSKEELLARARSASTSRTGDPGDTDSDDSDHGEPRPPAPPPDRMGNNEWCLCGNCRPMPSAIECLCCRERRNCREFFSQSVGCITLHPDFHKICLEKAVLRTALVARLDKRGHRGNLPRELDNESYRYSAYRLFTYWTHGLLGRGVRKVIPACAVLKIHATYPDGNGHYTGFQLGPDGEEMPVPEQFAI